MLRGTILVFNLNFSTQRIVFLSQVAPKEPYTSSVSQN